MHTVTYCMVKIRVTVSQKLMQEILLLLLVKSGIIRVVFKYSTYNLQVMSVWFIYNSKYEITLLPSMYVWFPCVCVCVCVYLSLCFWLFLTVCLCVCGYVLLPSLCVSMGVCVCEHGCVCVCVILSVLVSGCLTVFV